jgi:hypothetical protein
MGLQFRFKNVYITDYNWIQIRLNTSLENYDLEAIYWSSVLFYISGEMTVKHIRVCKRFCVQEWYVNIVLFTCKVRVKYIASDGRVVRRKKSTNCITITIIPSRFFFFFSFYFLFNRQKLWERKL